MHRQIRSRHCTQRADARTMTSSRTSDASPILPAVSSVLFVDVMVPIGMKVGVAEDVLAPRLVSADRVHDALMAADTLPGAVGPISPGALGLAGDS